MPRNVAHMVGTIFVPLESYLFLQQECHRQRSESGRQFTEDHIKRLERSFKNHCEKNGLYRLHDGNFGGCKGDPHRGWEEGRWTDWTAQEMAKMLDEHGLTYQMGEPEEIISVYL